MNTLPSIPRYLTTPLSNDTKDFFNTTDILMIDLLAILEHKSNKQKLNPNVIKNINSMTNNQKLDTIIIYHSSTNPNANYSCSTHDYRVYINEILDAIPNKQQIINMRLSSLYLNAIPDNLFLFTSIETLNISNNCFTEIPLGICELKELKNFRFDRNSNPLKIPNCLKKLNLEIGVDLNSIDNTQTLGKEAKEHLSTPDDKLTQLNEDRTPEERTERTPEERTPDKPTPLKLDEPTSAERNTLEPQIKPCELEESKNVIYNCDINLKNGYCELVSKNKSQSLWTRAIDFFKSPIQKIINMFHKRNNTTKNTATVKELLQLSKNDNTSTISVSENDPEPIIILFEGRQWIMDKNKIKLPPNINDATTKIDLIEVVPFVPMNENEKYHIPYISLKQFNDCIDTQLFELCILYPETETVKQTQNKSFFNTWRTWYNSNSNTDQITITHKTYVFKKITTPIQDMPEKKGGKTKRHRKTHTRNQRKRHRKRITRRRIGGGRSPPTKNK